MAAYVIFSILLVLCVIWVVIRLVYIPHPTAHTLYFGVPRSGKTMFLTKIAFKMRKKYRIYSNYPIKLEDVYKFQKSDLGKISFPEGSILLFDEASLSGFDNRDFKDNFRGNNAMEYFKLVGHFKNSIVWSNQGWDECDKKIRTLCSSLYLVKRLPLVSIAIRIYVNTGINKDTKEIIDGYKFASPFRLLLDPRCLFMVWRPKYGGFYNSWSRPKYQESSPQAWYHPSSTP